MSKYIIHLGISGFPSGSAPIQRIRLTLKGLKQSGFYPLVINKHSISTKGYPGIQRFDGIPFIFTSIKTERPGSFIFRNINRLSGIAGEAVLLIKKRKKLHTAILYTPSFGELVYYRMISKLLGFKMIVQYVELRSSIADRNTFFNRLNDKLFDNNFHFFCDGAIAISDFLLQHIKAKSSKLPVIKIPAMCDFAEFNFIHPYPAKSYLMYCGSIAYNEVIEFIIDIFSALKSGNTFDGDLVLVISGNHDTNWEKIKAKIRDGDFGKNIVIKSNIPYNELLSLYKGAEILMIPLRNTVQDIARFPHKIGEYTASGRPVLSTNLGELKIYFKDGISAILADEYSLSSYVKKLAEILPLKVNLDSIGKKGYETGIKNFDYQVQTLQLKQFILNL